MAKVGGGVKEARNPPPDKSIESGSRTEERERESRVGSDSPFHYDPFMSSTALDEPCTCML
jgi:hypothetical protein